MRRRHNPFPGVATVEDRHGKRRHRLRRVVNGRPVDVYLPGPYGSPAFRAAYDEAVEGARVATTRQTRVQPGTFRYLINHYLDSAAFRNLANDTRRSKRYRLDWLREAIGSGRCAEMEPRHVEALMQKKGGPAAGNRLKADLAQLFRFAAKHFNYTGPNPAALADALKVKARRLSHHERRRDRDLPGHTSHRNQGAAGV